MSTVDITDDSNPPQPGEETPNRVAVDAEGNPINSNNPLTPECVNRKRSRGPEGDPSDTNDGGNDTISPNMKRRSLISPAETNTEHQWAIREDLAEYYKKSAQKYMDKETVSPSILYWTYCSRLN